MNSSVPRASDRRAPGAVSRRPSEAFSLQYYEVPLIWAAAVLTVIGLWIGLALGLTLCGIVLVVVWHRRSRDLALTPAVVPGGHPVSAVSAPQSPLRGRCLRSTPSPSRWSLSVRLRE